MVGDVTKFHPVLFSDSEVIGLLDQRKTQFRRVLRPQPSKYTPSENRHKPTHEAAYFDAYCGARKTAENPRGQSGRWCWWSPDDRQGPDWVLCPYGVPGDTLWVREAFQVARGIRDSEGILDDEIVYTGPLMKDPRGHRCFDDWNVGYRADGSDESRWRPNVHMPRWASRFYLRVVNVRCEKLQAITELDAVAEGHVSDRDMFMRTDLANLDPVSTLPSKLLSARDYFRHQWYDTHGPESWDQNPYVFVIEFQRL